MAKLKIDISEETAEGFMRDMLIADYRNIREILYNQVNRTVETGSEAPLHPEDYEFYKKLFEAVKTYMEYYLADQDRKAILAE